MDKNLETALLIVETVIPNFFTFRLYSSEIMENGAYIREMSEKGENMVKDVCKLLEKQYGKSEE